MSESNDQDGGKGRLSLRPAGRLELGRTVDAGSVRQSFSHGRSKVVQVEVRKTRAPPWHAILRPPRARRRRRRPVPRPRRARRPSPDVRRPGPAAP